MIEAPKNDIERREHLLSGLVGPHRTVYEESPEFRASIIQAADLVTRIVDDILLEGAQRAAYMRQIMGGGLSDN